MSPTPEVLSNQGPVIAGCIFGSPPLWAKWRLPWPVRRFLNNHRTRYEVTLLWHPETRDHIALVNGVQLRLPASESEYPRFVGLDLSTKRNACRCYPRVRVDLAGYQTILGHSRTVGMSFSRELRNGRIAECFVNCRPSEPTIWRHDPEE